MLSKTALSLSLLAMAGPASVLAQVVTVWDSATTIVTVTAGAGASPAPVQEKVAEQPAQQAAASSSPAPAPPPAASSSPAPGPSPASGSGGSGGSDGPSGNLQSSGGKICFNFSGNNNFHFLNTGSWGSNSGSGTQAASQCFTPSANAGMYICESECQDSGDSAVAKYTKLECTLGGDWQNCDISLVDGFSLPLECTFPDGKPNATIGGNVDLNTLHTCPTKGDDNTCKNANSYEGDKSDVDQYFQAANVLPPATSAPGGNYCVYQTCSGASDVFFSGTPTVECKVGYSEGTSASKRDAQGADSPASDLSKREAGAARRAHGHRHSHAHAHARGVKDVVA